ncbi:hypothetical protein OnM2_030003 [Erysiphe neolycopersici]|uniref:Uncharacterized protein n=1 Tax=Erysiphe neolycopersici TaxID=212602 RepID=A0A420HZG4_9PEZI|nr:hypothetical protein OnM2_030003 [Erysiphe neolycopersici]
MAPFLSTIPVLDLVSHAQLNTHAKKRKQYDGLLEKCELQEMLQYMCEVEGERVVCRPVERIFRRCKDATGSFLVETTAWEKSKGPS